MTPPPSQVRPTPLGTVVLWIAVTLLLLGAVQISAPWILGGLLLLGAWFLGRHLAGRHLEEVAASRALPLRAWVGRSFAVEARITNRDSRSSAQDFRFTDPPSVSRSFAPLTLPPEGEASLTYAAKCHRRGRHRPANWEVVSQWPLGWFETRRIAPFELPAGQPDSLLVLPDPFLPDRLRNHIDGQLAASSPWNGLPDPTAEFRLLREFRPGDSVRRIHWPSSLKSGDLLVREPDPPRPSPRRYGILVHSFLPEREIVTPETFEMILRIVAGLLCRFRESGIEIFYQHLPGSARVLRFREDFDRELDRLATVFRTPYSSIGPVVEAVAQFSGCEELFVLGDCPRQLWQQEIALEAGSCHCIDAGSLSLAVRPTVKRTLSRSS